MIPTGGRMVSNPIEVHQALISELIFDEKDNWILEIDFGSYDIEDYDSISIHTSGGYSRLKLNSIPEGTHVYVINSDSLITPVSINRAGDTIELDSYTKWPPSFLLRDNLVFGHGAGSVCDSLQTGYSICRIDPMLFCKDKSPTIGFPNDTSGTLGTLRGHVYDYRGKIILQGEFMLPIPYPADFPLVFHPDSTFTARVFSGKTCMSELYIMSWTSIMIDSLCYEVDPDCVSWADIHLMMDYPHGISIHESSPDFQPSVINFPNPFNSVTNFSITIPQSLRSQKGSIKVYNVSGQEIKQIHVLANSTAQWDGTDQKGLVQPSGVYYYQLFFGNRVYSNGSMILLK